MKYFIANWKMNPASFSQAKRILRSLTKIRKASACVVICPPLVYLENLKKSYGRRFLWGAQNCFWKNEGPFTGETSPMVLKAHGVSHVILGHSERREHLLETDEMVRAKVHTVLALGLTPIICVGGGKEARKLEDPKPHIRKQLLAATDGLSARDVGRCIFAYEPVWAIGTGQVASAEHVSGVTAHIIRILQERFKLPAAKLAVIYGGSVDGRNAGDFVPVKNLSGFLVGGASLKPDQFSKIIKQF
jgi:triosephosphate isomerase